MKSGLKISAIVAALAITIYVIEKRKNVWRPYVVQENVDYPKTDYFRTYEQIKQFEKDWPEYTERYLVIDPDWGYCIAFLKHGEVQAYYQINWDTYSALRNDVAYEMLPLT